MLVIPQVSVGMPVFNGELFVSQAIESILGQTFGDLELVISDNGSTDGTEEICRRYAALDARVRYYRSPENRGAAWNYNNVFHLAGAPYFKWAAHDDLCAPLHLERCVEILDRHPSVVLCYPKTALIDPDGNSLGTYEDRFHLCSPKPHERLLQCLIATARTNPIFGVIRASALKQTPLIGNYIASDYIILAQLALLGEFFEIPQYLFFNRDHSHRSGRALRTHSQHAQWYDPNNRRSLHLRLGRLFYEYLASVRRAKLRASDRIRCYFVLLRWLRWRGWDLASEAYQAILTSTSLHFRGIE